MKTTKYLIVVLLALIQLNGVGSAMAADTKVDEDKDGMKETFRVLEERLKEARAQKQKDPAGMADTALMLAVNTLEYKQKSDALALFKEALASYNAIPADEPDSEVGKRFWQFVDSYMQKSLLRAEQLSIIDDWLDVYEEKTAGSATEPPDEFFAMVRYFRERRRGADAIAILKRDISLREKYQPFKTATMPELYVQLAEQYRMARRLDDMLPISRQWLSSSEAHYGKDDKSLLPPLTHLATIDIELGNFSESDQLTKRAVAIAKKVPGLEPLNPVVAIAWTLVEKGELARADAFLRDCCSKPRELSTLKYPNQLYQGVQHLAQVYSDQKDFQKGESLLTVWLAALAPGSADAVEPRQKLYQIYLEDAGYQQRKGDKGGSTKAISKATKYFNELMAYYKHTPDKRAYPINECRDWNRLIDEQKLATELKKSP